MDDRLVYTVAEIQRLTSMSETQVYREASGGRLRLRKIGSRTVITADDLRAYVDALPLARLTTAQR